MKDASQKELGESWIDHFIHYSKDFPTPYIYRKWAAIGAISCALERKVFLWFNNRITFANNYIMLVGKPGTGKTSIINEVYDMAIAVGCKTAPHSTTAAALFECIREAFKDRMPDGGIASYSSLAAIVDELAVWMPAHDNELMGILCKAWDNPTEMKAARITRKVEPIIFPQMNMLVGVQPKYLNALMPKDAQDMGIIARSLLVYSGEIVKIKLSIGKKGDNNILNKSKALAIAGLNRITKLQGEMTMTDKALEALVVFDEEPFELDMSLFENYYRRRILFAMKLAMISSVSEGSSLIIEERHVNWATKSLIELEIHMPEVYKEMKRPETSQVMSEVFNQMLILVRKPGFSNGIPEHKLHQLLADKVPAYQINNLVETMVKSRMIIEAPKMSTGKELASTHKCYKPLLENARN